VSGVELKIIKSLLPKLNIVPKTNIVPPMKRIDGIPKILHQTYLTRALPFAILRNVERIKILNPDWEYRFYDDKDIGIFIEKNYGSSILRYYNRIHPDYGAARADLFRYLLIYKCGGVYLDIKSTLLKPLNQVLRAEDTYLLSKWHDENDATFTGWGIHTHVNGTTLEEFQQWHIVASPGHPFLKAVIENVLRNIDMYSPNLHGTGKPGVLRLTGPIAYTLAITPLLHLQQHRFANSKSELGFEYSVFNIIDSHNALFKTHYSEMTKSIIFINDARAFFEAILRLLSSLRECLHKSAQ
jgi:hypothetical protein